jgi:chaperonin cofactor prefoldin
MLSIFEQKDFEQQPEKKLTLNRLQNVLGTPPGKPEATRLSVAVEEPGGAVKAAVSPAVPERRSTLPPPPDSSAPPVMPVAESRAPLPHDVPGAAHSAPAVERDLIGVPPELNQFAEQFTRGFREVLVNPVRARQAPMAEERRKLDSAFDSVTRTARDLEALADELSQAGERIDSRSNALQELTSRGGKLEDSVNIAAAAAHAIQEAQQALEKRFELQAGVIRSLNNSMQAREERLDKLFGAFQAIQGVGQPARRGSQLPDNL